MIAFIPTELDLNEIWIGLEGMDTTLQCHDAYIYIRFMSYKHAYIKVSFDLRFAKTTVTLA